MEAPIPLEAIAELEKKLGRSLAGWDEHAPRFVSPQPDIEGAWFDVPRVVRLVEALRSLPHTKGNRWAGSPFDPEPWQVIWLLAPVFGWKHPDGHRIIRELWDEVPRKNGKSSIASRLAVTLLAADGEIGAEVYAAATSEAQARVVADDVIAVVRAPVLHGKVEILPASGIVRVPRTGSMFRVLSRVAEAAHGLNVHAAIIDEIHVHRKRDLIDAIETGTGARDQPLLVYITTAGDDDETTIYAEKHGRAIKIAKGEVLDPTVWVAIWSADPQDDPFDHKVWAKANPNYPIAPSHEYLVEKARKAQDTPTFLPTFLRLHLNIRTTMEGTPWVSRAVWNQSVGMVVPEKLRGKRCYAGMVAASATDLSAICLTFANPEGPGVWAMWRWFLPEESLPSLDERTGGHASVWAKPGGPLRLTEGNVIDIGAHTDQLLADAREYDIKELVYDPNGAVGIVQPIMEARAIDVVAIYATSPGSAMVDWERLVKSKEYNHGSDPIATWQVGNVVVREAATGIWKIDRRASRDNVFGVAAGELALRRFLAQIQYRSAYEDRGVMSV